MDYYWDKFTADDGEESKCGWLMDKFGISRQIVPEFIVENTAQGDPARLGNMMQAVFQMKKLITEIKAHHAFWHKIINKKI